MTKRDKSSCNWIIKYCIPLVLLATISACSKQSEVLEFNKDTEVDTPEGAVRSVMRKFAIAAKAGDIEKIAALHSERFVSEDAVGKEGIRELWTMISSSVFLRFVNFDVDTAQIKVDGNYAKITLFEDDGDVEMIFVLEREEDAQWLIVGAPEHEEVASFDRYLEPYGDDCVKHGDYFRCWNIQIPSVGQASSPLVIDLHGHSSSPEEQRRMSGFDKKASSQGFIAVWPFGLARSWNAGGECCGDALEKNIDDTGFLRELILKVASEQNVDLKRVYLTGLSNGCAMAQRFSVEASDLVAATACVSLHLLTKPSEDFLPTPVMMFYGTEDRDIYEPTGDDIPSAKENFMNWAILNGCLDPAVDEALEGITVKAYKNCDAGSEVVMVTIKNGGHELYEGAHTDINTTELAWNFLRKFSR